VDLNLLKHAAMFQDLDEGELARVAEVCREQKFTAGQYIFKEGEPGNRLFIIAEGEVRISRTIPGSDFELLLDFNRDIAYKVLWSVVRLLSSRLRVTNDNLRSFLAMSMF
jgi:CRP/FNR family cyclic AMP-dependent transcriptional regulator